jgi:beta-xylosidase
MRRRALLAAGLSLPFAAACGPSVAQGGLTLPDMPLHDPWIVTDKASGTYYLYTSNIGRVSGEAGIGVMAYTSKDLRTWQKAKRVFALPAGIWANAGCWAPEVHAWKGRYYLFVTVHNDALPLPGDGNGSGEKLIRRGTILAVSDSLDGPFTVVRDGEPVVSKDLMTLDGTLYVDTAGQPWMVYAHEWIQTRIGTIEAVPLDDDLKAKGPPILLFKGSDSSDVAPQRETGSVVTDGPELYHTGNGNLVMLWSSWGADGYIQTQAVSQSSKLEGPWKQLPFMLGKGSGHGMVFTTVDGRRMLIVHRPFKSARGKLYDVDDSSDRIVIVSPRPDLDLDPAPLYPNPPIAK